MLLNDRIWLVSATLYLGHRFMFLGVKTLTDCCNRHDAMFAECIEKPSKNHLNPFYEGFTVTSALRMRNRSLQIIYNRKEVFDQSLVSKANRLLLFATSSFPKIF